MILITVIWNNWQVERKQRTDTGKATVDASAKFYSVSDLSEESMSSPRQPSSTISRSPWLSSQPNQMQVTSIKGSSSVWTATVRPFPVPGSSRIQPARASRKCQHSCSPSSQRCIFRTRTCTWTFTTPHWMFVTRKWTPSSQNAYPVLNVSFRVLRFGPSLVFLSIRLPLSPRRGSVWSQTSLLWRKSTSVTVSQLPLPPTAGTPPVLGVHGNQN